MSVILAGLKRDVLGELGNWETLEPTDFIGFFPRVKLVKCVTENWPFSCAISGSYGVQNSPQREARGKLNNFKHLQRFPHFYRAKLTGMTEKHDRHIG